MSRVKIENDQLIITMQGARKFFALKSEVSIHLSNITGVTSGLEWKDLPKALDKRFGTNANSFYYGGYFNQEGRNVFYDLKRKEDAVVIHIKDENFDTVVIGVDDPEATIALIEQGLHQRKP
ncbi:MAG: hypothetical protein FWC90_00065 [Oscillospiraceae bacterium]|nr:hypothetical protein [Oscillospiraceae bacterium]